MEGRGEINAEKLKAVCALAKFNQMACRVGLDGAKWSQKLKTEMKRRRAAGGGLALENVEGL
jgi:hypothetical protein